MSERKDTDATDSQNRTKQYMHVIADSFNAESSADGGIARNVQNTDGGNKNA